MRVCLSLFVALSFALAAAQTFPTPSGVVATDSARLDVAAINEAAQSLQAQGADVLVLFIEGDVGSSLAEAETYLDEALTAYGLRDGATNRYDPQLLSFFIGTAPLVNDNDQRPLYVVYGERFSAALEARQGGVPFVENVQGSVLVPRLLDGDFTGAITAALAAVTAQLEPEATAVSGAPSRVNPVQETAPASPTAEDPAAPSRLNRTVWLLTAVFAALFLIYLARRLQKPATSGADARLKVLKGKLSEHLIDLAGSEARSGHDPFLPADPNAQTDMVLLTGLLQDERPAELAALQDEYRAASQSLEATEKAFEALRSKEERLNRRSPELASYVERYEALLVDLKTVTAFTERLSGQWQALQSLVADIPQRLKRLRADIEGARTGVRSQFLGRTPTFETLFARLDTRLEDAVSSFQNDQGLKALREAEGLEADLAALRSATGRLAALEQAVDAFRQQLDAWRARGAPRDFARQSLDEVKEQAVTALNLLEQSDFKVVDAQLDEAEERLTAARENAEKQILLHEDNTRRLGELEKVGEETEMHIERAALTFDLVDDFAPANWRDIRGNGSEAQKAAAAAHAFWQQAQRANKLEQPQGVPQAAQALDAAEAELKQAENLLEAVEKRLETLRAAQETAQRQLEEVDKELSAHRDTLRRHELERELSSAPRESLEQAETLVTEVRGLLSDPRPDWLSALAKVQEADRLADLALATIKQEQEALAQRRRMLESEKAEAESSLERVVQFVRIHKPDLQAVNLTKVQGATDTYRHAQELEANAQRLSGHALVTTLKEAALVFDEAQRLADAAFSLLEVDFQTAESLRQETAETVAQTRASFASLERFVRSGGLSASMNASLSALANDLPRYDASLTPDRLRATLDKATNVEREIERLHGEARRHVEAVQSAQRQERLRQLETARRRRAAQDARQRSSWGSWPERVPTSPRPQSSARTAPRAMPRAPSAPPITLPARSGTSGGRSGGGWGGGGRKSGRGW